MINLKVNRFHIYSDLYNYYLMKICNPQKVVVGIVVKVWRTPHCDIANIFRMLVLSVSVIHTYLYTIMRAILSTQIGFINIVLNRAQKFRRCLCISAAK